MAGGVRRASEGAWVSATGRGDLLRNLDDALARLDTDYVDVWMVERAGGSLEETLEAASAHRSGHYATAWDCRGRHGGLAGVTRRGVVGAGRSDLSGGVPFSLGDTSRSDGCRAERT